jgi:hypothetical protein
LWAQVLIFNALNQIAHTEDDNGSRRFGVNDPRDQVKDTLC